MNSFRQNSTVVLVHGVWADGSYLSRVPCRDVDDGRFDPYGRRRDQDHLGREISGARCGALEAQPSRVI